MLGILGQMSFAVSSVDFSWTGKILISNYHLSDINVFIIFRVFGMQLGTIIFATTVLLGQIIFALGGIFNKFWLMEVGRFVFGRRVACCSPKQLCSFLV